MSTKSLVNAGFDSIAVDAECSITNGLPSFTIVGLASKAVEEAKERIRASLHKSSLILPRKRIVINLAPADLPKDTTSLDLPIAISILLADGQIKNSCENSVFIGELGLDGAIRPVKGIIGKLVNKRVGCYNKIFIPEGNKNQVKLLNNNNIYSVNTLKDVVNHLNGLLDLKPISPIRISVESDYVEDVFDFGEVYGQESAKRALIIAASGGHNVLLSGPPGTGKSMLAKAFCSILPNLSVKQSLEVTNIHSLSFLVDEPIFKPPLRSPHHTASDIAIIGGGHNLKPGEISLAHNGVLFMDELPEFSRSALESLRQPLEDGNITISRAQNSVTFPSSFILIATRNPCPCGYLDSSHPCSCTAAQINTYSKKISGPIIDRIDIHVFVGEIEHKQLLKDSGARQSPCIRKVVASARKIQINRQNGILNSKLANRQLKKYAALEPDAEMLLNSAAGSLKISPRSYMRTVKLARTIADIEQSKLIAKAHVAEALQYRPKHKDL